jgi:hypothetical protein
VLIKPTISDLLECFTVDEESGDLFWKERPEEHFASAQIAKRWNSRWAGAPALSADNGKGYLAGVLTLSGKVFRLQRHRVIFAMVSGAWPLEHVDHMDGNTLNNRPNNLRAASNQENMRNNRMSKANTSGATGVYWFKPRSKWLAMIGVDGKLEALGYFQQKEDAVAARKAAEAKYGFSERHGCN